ncbi:hypothetical protein AYX14_07143 [Cryptococcus neoformans]|nr:hypothetical protein AYX15_07155 [Cryptococcus neoformans var. grubii]OWZ60564.1 hypothetical protein AYX14_07143 [Cryptococcus neoformans var. grubii]
MTDAAEDAGEALGVREAGEGTAEALDLLLCLSEMMPACRRLTGQCMLLSAKYVVLTDGITEESTLFHR